MLRSLAILTLESPAFTRWWVCSTYSGLKVFFLPLYFPAFREGDTFGLAFPDDGAFKIICGLLFSIMSLVGSMLRNFNRCGVGQAILPEVSQASIGMAFSIILSDFSRIYQLQV